MQKKFISIFTSKNIAAFHAKHCRLWAKTLLLLRQNIAAFSPGHRFSLFRLSRPSEYKSRG